MSRRLFSEFLDEITSAPTSDPQAEKRRKTGLNSRFDRMVQTMNLTHRSPVKKLPRRRAQSTSSTSGSGSSVPRTPIDHYDQYHHDGRLGKEFSVIKMPKRMARWDQESQASSDELEPPPPAPHPTTNLPTWLADTFSELNTTHPLRLLLPARTDSEPKSVPMPMKDGNKDGEETRFSFSLEPSSCEEPPSTETSNPEPASHGELISQPPSLPFSTPGPASHLVVTPPRSQVFFPPIDPIAIPQTENSYTFAHFRHVQPSEPHNQEDDALLLEPYYAASSPAQENGTDVFSTPGPGYAPPPVYFDSPTADPESDPLQPGYELDSLDFRWEPFIQKAAADDYYYETRAEPDGEDDEDGQLYMKISMEPARSPSCTPFSFAPPPDTTPAKTPERSAPACFAPAPGIFISPLRGSGAEESPKHAAAVEGSQTSDDSIEDWDDV
ncbi:hypothetical protein FB45DRAFT_196525 [Roridomyces roridus]|uniref:Uncharacterized protein n=1 Tax=Roridomyces roridus TaxID=1738132 RepID=A0AAD7FZ98_9AGAR|nr:hypothetical protein FB45DRAFT_196525 [Roridomyces roridus]